LCLVAGSRVNQTCISVRRPPWSFGGSPASQRPSGLVWSGVDDFVRGTETPPSWAISLSGNRDQGDRDTTFVHFRTTAQGSIPCLITHSRANLALTLTKLVLMTKDLNSMLLDGLEVFLGVCVCVMSWHSSKLQMAGRAHIYRPPTRTSR